MLLLTPHPTMLLLMIQIMLRTLEMNYCPTLNLNIDMFMLSTLILVKTQKKNSVRNCWI